MESVNWSLWLRKNFIPSSIIKQKLDVERSILFTFDDGPDPDITPRVLDVLEQNGARGLFFIPGNRVIRAPKLIKEIIDRRHWIGNHGFTHTSCSRLSFGQMVDEINRCKEEILSKGGFATEFYRPPMGIVSPSLFFATVRCKHKIMRWSIDSGEYSYMKNATSCALADNFFARVHDRAIVLSHDDKETTPGFLKLVLPRLVDNGFDLGGGLLSLKRSKTGGSGLL